MPREKTERVVSNIRKKNCANFESACHEAETEQIKLHIIVVMMHVLLTELTKRTYVQRPVVDVPQ